MLILFSIEFNFSSVGIKPYCTFRPAHGFA